MHNKLFPILGTAMTPMVGRSAVFQKMINGLSKSIPDHLQVVGPRFAGKTVILHELAKRLRIFNSPFSCVLFWDLGHQTPSSDNIFMQCFAKELSTALKDSHPDYAEHLRTSHDNSYQDISEVLDLLKEDGVMILVIMDGFDKPLSNGKLTRNLWDQLRELALKPSLRLVTASRRTLRDLIRNPAAQTSDFWNIFDPNPVRIGCFDERDRTDILALLPKLKLDNGAITELWNASNGFPVLTLSILNVLLGKSEEGILTAEKVRGTFEEVYAEVSDKLDALWLDCPPSSQDLMRRVIEEKSVSRSGIPNADADTLIERGFVQISSNKFQSPCRLIMKYLEIQPHEGSTFLRLFGNPDSYQKNIKNVFERRISHLENIDPSLKRFLERATADLPDFPDVFMTNVRGIVDRAFDLIWEVEMPDKKIPSSWISFWEYNKENGIDKFKLSFPQGGQRVSLLRLMTGTEKSTARANFISKSTFTLISGVNSFGDFGQHQAGNRIDQGTAFAALYLCIELAASLSRDLRK
jgi:hypothetical protein